MTHLKCLECGEALLFWDYPNWFCKRRENLWIKLNFKTLNCMSVFKKIITKYDNHLIDLKLLTNRPNND